MLLQIQLGMAFAVVFLLVVVLWVRSGRLLCQLREQAESLEKKAQQLAVLQEAVRNMGRQLVEQECRLNGFAGAEPPASGVDADAEAVIRLLDQGRSIEQIAEATGLDEVEVSLLQQIRGGQQSEAGS